MKNKKEIIEEYKQELVEIGYIDAKEGIIVLLLIDILKKLEEIKG